ncbi:unnamed protein product, partial [Choristocarpus tenellus]
HYQNACRLAVQIEGRDSVNRHCREERNRMTPQDLAMGEEERYSSVPRAISMGDRL